MTRFGDPNSLKKFFPNDLERPEAKTSGFVYLDDAYYLQELASGVFERVTQDARRGVTDDDIAEAVEEIVATDDRERGVYALADPFFGRYVIQPPAKVFHKKAQPKYARECLR